MIECGWCGFATEAPCSHCGRDPELPWIQRGLEAPKVKEETGRPTLDPSQIRQKLRIARKELNDPTNAELAEHLGISERTLGRWQLLAGK